MNEATATPADRVNVPRLNRRAFVTAGLASLVPIAAPAPKPRVLASIPEVFVPIGSTSFEAVASFRNVDNSLVQQGTAQFYWQKTFVATVALVDGAATCPIQTAPLSRGVHYYQVRLLSTRSYSAGVFTAGVAAI